MLSARTGVSPIYNPMPTPGRGDFKGRPPVAQRNKENIAPNGYEDFKDFKECFNMPPNRTVSSARLGDSARIMDSTSGAPGEARNRLSLTRFRLRHLDFGRFLDVLIVSGAEDSARQRSPRPRALERGRSLSPQGLQARCRCKKQRFSLNGMGKYDCSAPKWFGRRLKPCVKLLLFSMARP